MKKPLDKGGAVEEGLLCPMFATDALLRGLCCMLRDVYKKSLGSLYLVSRLVILFFTNRPYDDDIKKPAGKTR